MLELACDNLKLNKIAILDGSFDCELASRQIAYSSLPKDIVCVANSYNSDKQTLKINNLAFLFKLVKQSCFI